LKYDMVHTNLYKFNNIDNDNKMFTDKFLVTWIYSNKNINEMSWCYADWFSFDVFWSHRHEIDNDFKMISKALWMLDDVF